MKVAFYTCITGGYDSLKRPAKIDERIDYYVFSDDTNIAVPPWDYRAVPVTGLTSKDANRYVKMLPHEIDPLNGYDVTIYVDGSVALVGDVFEFAATIAKKPGTLFLFEHNRRNCVYDEAYACAFYGLESAVKIGRQILRYKKEGYPEGKGLYEATVIARKRDDDVSRLMGLWWDEYSKGAKRDQLFLNYLAWREGFSISSLGQSDPFITQILQG